MGERFHLRKPTKREVVGGGLLAAAGAAFLAYSESQPTQKPAAEPTAEGGPTTTDTTTSHRPHPDKPRSPEAATPPDHEAYREQMSDQVLGRLADLDPNFSVTRTTAVNDRPVNDQFFGISYKMPDGNYRELGQVYPDEHTGLLHLDPGEELRSWVQNRTGMELTSLSTNDADQLTDGATDLLKLRDLMDKDRAGETVSTSAIAEQLMRNETVTTEEAREEQEENRKEAADTGH